MISSSWLGSFFRGPDLLPISSRDMSLDFRLRRVFAELS